jgi:hypothetical protein
MLGCWKTSLEHFVSHEMSPKRQGPSFLKMVVSTVACTVAAHTHYYEQALEQQVISYYDHDQPAC